MASGCHGLLHQNNTAASQGHPLPWAREVDVPSLALLVVLLTPPAPAQAPDDPPSVAAPAPDAARRAHEAAALLDTSIDALASSAATKARGELWMEVAALGHAFHTRHEPRWRGVALTLTLEGALVRLAREEHVDADLRRAAEGLEALVAVHPDMPGREGMWWRAAVAWWALGAGAEAERVMAALVAGAPGSTEALRARAAMARGAR